MELAIKPVREDVEGAGRRRPIPPLTVQLILEHDREDGLQIGLFGRNGRTRRRDRSRVPDRLTLVGSVA